MKNDAVYKMSFAKIFPLLQSKAVKKGRSEDEVFEVITWLSGYSKQEILQMVEDGIPYGQFFEQAPNLNPKRTLITGVVCGIRVESISDPLMREVRYLDKLIDELAKGKPLEKILRT